MVTNVILKINASSAGWDSQKKCIVNRHIAWDVINSKHKPRTVLCQGKYHLSYDSNFGQSQ